MVLVPMSVRLFPMVMGMLMIMTKVVMKMHGAACSADPASLIRIEVQMPAIVWKLAQFGLKCLGVDSKADHRAEIHVAADTGGAVVDEGRHGIAIGYEIRLSLICLHEPSAS